VAAYDLSASGQLTLRGSALATSNAHAAVALTPNQAPLAKFDPVAAPAGAASTFQAAPSSDVDGNIASWSWDFGDGTTGNGSTTTHIYQQPGTYQARLTVTDNEGCSTGMAYTGQFTACTGGPSATHTEILVVVDPPPKVTPDPPCIHDGNDGFCGTSDSKAPRVNVLGFRNGASITTLDAPQEIVGTITPDPSGIGQIRLRFVKADGTVAKKTTVTRRVCHKVRGTRRCKRQPLYKKACKKIRGRRRCKRTKVVKTVGNKVPMCLTVSGTKNYLVRYVCSKVPWLTVAGETSFRYSLPVALGTGAYSVEVVAVDNAGNSDTLEDGRNSMKFKIISTPSNQDSGGGAVVGDGTTNTTPTTPIDDTGSPFG
jgi:PKD repeat protein